jgi:5-formyltetrahydrofolate cyclo-ligase
MPGLQVTPGTVVAGYWPLADELDPRPLMLALHGRSARLVLPVIEARGRPLRFRLWEPGAPLRVGRFGIAEPGEDAPELDPAIVLVPLLAFDRRGSRLGYGAGFYDRTLAGLRARGPVLAVGVAFAAQEVPFLPCDALDQPLDRIVTEAGAFEPASGRGRT